MRAMHRIVKLTVLLVVLVFAISSFPSAFAENYICPFVSTGSSVVLKGIQRQMLMEDVNLSDDGKYSSSMDQAVAMWSGDNGYDSEEVRASEVLVNLVRSHYMGYPISLNEPSDELLAVQALLRRWGFYSEEITDTPNDELSVAVSEFKDYLTIPDEAVFDGIEVYDAASAIDYNTAEAMFYGFSPLTSTISWSSPYKDVRRVQRRMHTLGYYNGPFDGVWDEILSDAVEHFQNDNGISEIDAGMDTQSLLFSDRAELTVDLSKGYKIIVNIKESYISVMGWAGGGWNKEVKHFVCSCGAKKTPTPKGDFKLIERSGEWHQLNSEGWCRYAYRVYRYVYFHSWLYAYKGDTKIRQHSDELLGQNVSHGCIRMSVEDCKWLYENCEPGTPVHIS